MVNLYTQQGIQAASSAALNAQNAELSRTNTNLLSLQSKDYEKYGTSTHSLSGVAIPFTRALDRLKNMLRRNDSID